MPKEVAQVATLEFSSRDASKKDADFATVPLKSIKKQGKDYNARKSSGLDKESIEQLAATIKAVGLDRPITVKPDPDRDGGYLLVHGERRYEALKSLGWENVPVVIKAEVDRKQALVMMLLDSSDGGHVPLQIPELASAFRELEAEGMTTKDIGRRTGFNYKYVQRLLTIDGNAPDRIKKMLRDNTLSTQAALTFSEQDEDVRDAILPKIKDNTTADEIKALAKQVAKEQVEAVATGGKTPTGKKAAKLARTVSAKSWRRPKEVNPTIESICYAMYHTGDGTEKDEGGLAERDAQLYTSGVLAGLLYTRGDLESFSMPFFFDEKTGKFTPDGADDSMSATRIAQLAKLIKSEAAAHEDRLAKAVDDEDDSDDEAEESKGKKGKSKSKAEDAKPKPKAKGKGKGKGKSMVPAEDVDSGADEPDDDEE